MKSKEGGIEDRAGNPIENSPQPSHEVLLSRDQIIGFKAKAVKLERDTQILLPAYEDDYSQTLQRDMKDKRKVAVEVYNALYQTLGDGKPVYMRPEIEEDEKTPTSVWFDFPGIEIGTEDLSLWDNVTQNIYPLKILPVEQYKAQPNYEANMDIREAIKAGRTVVLNPAPSK